MKRGCLSTSLVLLVLVSCWLLFLADERTKKVILDPEGKISQGSAFGVKIGISAQDSVIALRQAGFTDLSISDSPPWFAEQPGADRYIYGYDFGWRHGVACIMLRQGKVQAVAWNFNMLNP
jgi:hypothetical protein